MIGKNQLLILFLVTISLRGGFGQVETWKRFDQMIAKTGYPVKLWVNVTESYAPQSITFDACEVLTCGDLNAQRRLSKEHKYLCPEPRTGNMFKGPPCSDWADVWWTTNHKGWSYTPTPIYFMRLKEQINIFKGMAQPDCQHLQCNPITITVNRADYLTNRTYGLGAEVTGRDPTARLRIAVRERLSPAIIEREKLKEKLKEKAGEKTGESLQNKAVVTVKEIKDLRQTFEVETGYGDVNAWIEWVRYTVQSLNHSNCYACA